MLVELLRLVLGLAILMFHARIAHFVMARERALVVLFRERGVPVPLLTQHTAENIYFGVGVFVCMLELFRIWLLLHP
jgi:hypothetical protein